MPATISLLCAKNSSIKLSGNIISPSNHKVCVALSCIASLTSSLRLRAKSLPDLILRCISSPILPARKNNFANLSAKYA